jgi:EmrB/QacA subfamily drug resistance transporter
MSTLSPTRSRAPDRHLGRAWSRFAVPVILLGQLMAIIDVAIVNIALPSIQRRLDFADSDLVWVADAYTLAYGGLVLLGGRAADLFGKRRMFLAGITLFTLASLACGVAGSPAVLIVARLVQGIGAALLTPAALALITVMTPAGSVRTKAMALYGAMGGLGVVLGQVLGGVFADGLSWRWCFLINVPFGIAVLIVGPKVLREERSATRRSLDLPGALTATAGLLLLVWGSVRAGSRGWGDTGTLLTLGAALALLAVFAVVEARSRDAMLPVALLKSRPRILACVYAVLFVGGVYTVMYAYTQVVQTVLGYSPLTAGLAVLPCGLMMFAAAGATEKLLPRTGPMPLLAAAGVLLAVAAFWVSRADVGTSYVTGVLPPLLLHGIGVALAMVTLPLLVVADVTDENAGIASGLLWASQEAGGTVAVAVQAAIITSTAHGVLRDGLSQGLLFTVGLALCAALLAATQLRGKR